MKKQVQLLLMLVALNATTVLNAKTFIANDFASLKTAVGAVYSGTGGDTVKITGNILLTESINFQKDVTITAETNSDGSPKYTIDEGNVNLFFISGDIKNCTVENLIFTNGGLFGGLTISMSNDSTAVATVNNCIANNNADVGIHASAGFGKVVISNCTANNNTGYGIMVSALTSIIHNCTANGNQKFDGILVLGLFNSRAFIDGCTAVGNTEYGIEVLVAFSIINRCAVSLNGKSGIYLEDAGKCIMSNTTASNNTEYGIRIDGTHCKLINCTICGNHVSGINRRCDTNYKYNRIDVYNSIVYGNLQYDFEDDSDFTGWTAYNTVYGTAKNIWNEEFANNPDCRTDDPKLLGMTATGSFTENPNEIVYYDLDEGSSASGLADKSLFTLEELITFISEGATKETADWIKSILTAEYIMNIIIKDQLGNIRSFDNNFYDAGSIAGKGEMTNSRIVSYSPQKIANYGEGTISFYGYHFADSTKISLKKQGETDIATDNYSIEDKSSVAPGLLKYNASFNFNKKSIGTWDIVVDFGDTIVTVKNGLEIEDYTEPTINIDIFGSNSIRPGVWTNYTVLYQNMGNADIYNVPIIIEVLTDKKAIVSVKEGWNYVVPAGLDTTQVARVDTLIDPFTGQLRTYIAPNIRYVGANGSGILSFALKIEGLSAGSSVEVSAKALNPMIIMNPDVYQASAGALRGAGGPCGLMANKNFSDCTQAAVDIGIEAGMAIAGALIPGFSCLSSAVSAGCNSVQNINEMDGLHYAGNLAWDYTKVALDCITDFIPVTKIGKAVWKTIEVMKSADDWINRANMGLNAFNNCGKKGPKSPGKLVGSIDPNDKTGPVSESGSTWFSDRKDFPYVINFENQSSATAPAQEIMITDTLDLNVFDITTFEAGFIKIGSRLIEAPVHIQNFTWTVDMPEKGLVTTIDLQLDKVKGIATWHFTCIDPKTGVAPTDALAGFLPPNDDNGSGQGSVFYSIQLKDGLADNAVVANKASIVFDNNESILTPTWVNQKDIVAPTSQMTEATDAGAGKVNLKWQGTDNAGGSGVYSYDVYAKQGAGDYLLIFSATTETAGQFQTDGISEYAFYTIATDNAGNRELKANVPDLTFTDIKVVTPESENMFSLSPNPARTECTVTLDVERQGNIKIMLLNLLGAKVMKIYDGGVEAGRFTQTFSTGSLPTGVYTVIVYTADNKIRAEKLLIAR